jgi:hypothetical protein
VKAHTSNHPDKMSGLFNIRLKRQQWFHWRPHRDMKWWRQNTDGTVYEQVKGQLILVATCMSLSK